MRARAVLAALLTVLAVTLVAACGAGPGVVRGPSVDGSTPGLPADVTIPSDGLSLREADVDNGPAAVSVPATSRFDVRADTAQEVTLVFAAPAPQVVGDYLRRALPTTGFTITEDRDGVLIFTGYGWVGTFLVTGDACALTVRPQNLTPPG